MVTRYCEGINNFEVLRTYSISVTNMEHWQNDTGQLLSACFATETKCRTKIGHYKKCKNVMFVKKSCAYIRILSAQLLFFTVCSWKRGLPHICAHVIILYRSLTLAILSLCIFTTTFKYKQNMTAIDL